MWNLYCDQCWLWARFGFGPLQFSEPHWTKRPCQLRHRRLCVNLTTDAKGGHMSCQLMVRSQKELNFISALQYKYNEEWCREYFNIYHTVDHILQYPFHYQFSCITLCFFTHIQDDQKVSVHLMITVQNTIPTQLMIWRWPSQNTFGMWTVLYWKRSSRTQFGVSINVLRLAGDTLNITCNFLYCNHQVHRLFDNSVLVLPPTRFSVYLTPS
jgi:hypothetical protein